ncbi:MAG: LysR family transcriptional regulator, partial [Thiothrix sp.]|nr:LysR family transcriptional regulator [Thiothrix sp.]
MDLRQLRYFLEIVERGSLTRASETLHVAQPALSFHLRNM